MSELVARVFDLAWQDTEVAMIELNGLDNGQLQYVEVICRALAAKAKHIREERLVATASLPKRRDEA